MWLDKHVIAIYDVSDIILLHMVGKVIKIIFDKLRKSSKSNYCKKYIRTSLTQVRRGYMCPTLFRFFIVNVFHKSNHHSNSKIVTFIECL